MTHKFITRFVAAALTLMVALAPSVANAQMRWAATVGGMYTGLKFKQDIVPVNQVGGFAAGIIGEVIFPGIGLGVDLGAQYEMRGANVHLGQKPIWADNYRDARFFLHTLSIPVHLRWKYTKLNGFEETLAPFIYVGPEFGFTLGHSRIDAFSFPLGEVGLEFGLGAEIKRRWQVSAQYNLGLTYVTKAKLLTNYSARNTAWKISVAYFFK